MLRAVNVSGRAVQKEKLRGLYESMGFEEVKTYLQSGNVIFSTPRTEETDLIQLVNNLERKLFATFGFEISVIARTIAQLNHVVKNNPFSRMDEEYLHVTFFRDKPNSISLEDIQNAKTGSEKYSFSSKDEVYLFCPYGYGRTKLNNAFFERKLGVLATTRNWRTVTALAKGLS